MAKFLVIVVDLGVESGDGADVEKVVPCEDAAAVGAAISDVDTDVATWALFEAKDGKYARRSVTFGADGTVTVG